jgi:hypothetical protein
VYRYVVCRFALSKLSQSTFFGNVVSLICPRGGCELNVSSFDRLCSKGIRRKIEVWKLNKPKQPYVALVQQAGGFRRLRDIR